MKPWNVVRNLCVVVVLALALVTAAPLFWDRLPTWAQTTIVSLADVQTHWFRINTCLYTITNRLNDGTDYSITTTASIIQNSQQDRCQTAILNTSTDSDVKCSATVDRTPTSTKGFTLYAGLGITLDAQATEEWQCVRAASATSNVPLSVVEIVRVRP